MQSILEWAKTNTIEAADGLTWDDIRAKRNDITQSLTDAFKGISFDQVAERLGKSLGVDEKTSQALIKQTGMTAEKFKTLDDKGLGVFVQSLIDASGVVDTYSKNLQSLSDQAAQEAGIEEAKAVVSMVQGIKKDLGGEDEASQRQIVEAFIKSQDTNLFNKLRKRDDFDTMSADKLMNFFETSMEKGAFKGQTGQKAEEIMIEQGQAFFKELLTQQLGADTFQKLAGGDIDKFIEDNVTGFAMRGFQSFGDYEEEHLGKTTSKLVDKLLNQAMMEQNRKSVEARRIFQEKKMEEDYLEEGEEALEEGDETLEETEVLDEEELVEQVMNRVAARLKNLSEDQKKEELVEALAKKIAEKLS